MQILKNNEQIAWNDSARTCDAEFLPRYSLPPPSTPYAQDTHTAQSCCSDAHALWKGTFGFDTHWNHTVGVWDPQVHTLKILGYTQPPDLPSRTVSGPAGPEAVGAGPLGRRSFHLWNGGLNTTWLCSSAVALRGAPLLIAIVQSTQQELCCRLARRGQSGSQRVEQGRWLRAMNDSRCGSKCRRPNRSPAERRPGAGGGGVCSGARFVDGPCTTDGVLRTMPQGQEVRPCLTMQRKPVS